jgi:hypothetical protein
MIINATTLGIILASASLAVIGLLIHYIVRVGSRYDPLCVYGLLAVSFGLLQSARVQDAPINLFSAIGFGFALLCIALVVWWEGLRRFRDAG